MRILDALFDPSGLTPHGFCLLWQPALIWIHAVSDAVTGLAYFAIPVQLAIIARRRRDLSFRPVFVLFAAFILLCGAGHWFDLLTLWVPVYRAEGMVKAATAIVSIGTAIAVWWLLPQAVALPSPAQLREASAALNESEARHRASFERSPVPLYMLNNHGIITGVSESWLTLLGYAKHEVVGRPISAFLALESESLPELDWNDPAAARESFDQSGRFRRGDGSLVDALVSARLERRDNSAWIVCVLIDITARRRAEEALRASEDRLRQAQKMEAVGQLTGGIAHDFNNMLQGIAGSLDLMDRRFGEGSAHDAERYMVGARKSLERAASLTQRMLAFGRRQTLQPRAVGPDVLMRGMADLIGRTVGPSIEVRLDVNEAGWSARCDANQLENALLNLAINARDAMPSGGTLTLSIRDRQLSAFDLSEQDEALPGDYVELAVSDTGEGMTPDVLRRAVEPFFTTKPIGRGTGLGLSQVYGFVRQSGGLVRLQSEPGSGTTVRLYLPRDHSAAPPLAVWDVGDQARRPPGHRPDATGRTVLLVEDEAFVRNVIAEALCDLGCRVLQAEDGPAGLRIAQSQEPLDLLVTDVGLPGLNGRQLADAARVLRPVLPVLLITGYAGAKLDDMELPSGMEVIAKPFKLDALTARVGALLDAVPAC